MRQSLSHSFTNIPQSNTSLNFFRHSSLLHTQHSTTQSQSSSTMHPSFCLNATNLIVSMSTDELNSFTSILNDVQASKARNPESRFVQTAERKKYKNSGINRAKSAKPKVQPAGITLAAKRPLNSWIAFRSYYSPIFTSFQQKDISGFLTRMWSDDFFHAKWTIIAKAYSVIRDMVGKARAPLDKFLQIVCPLINIIQPDFYLDTMGWWKPKGQHMELFRRYTPNITLFSAEVRTTTLSVDDVVNHCSSVGYHTPQPSGKFTAVTSSCYNDRPLTISTSCTRH